MRTAVLAVVSLLLPLAASAATLVSSRTFDGAFGSSDSIRAAVPAPGGGYYLAGHTFGANDGDIWVLKLDAGLNVVSSITLNGPANGYDFGAGIGVSTGGEVYVVGATSVTSVGMKAWVGRFSSSLALVSSYTYIGGQAIANDFNTSFDALAFEPSGDFLVVGDAYVNPGDPWSSVTLFRFSPTLTLLATAAYNNGFASEYGSSILRVASGDIYVGGGVAPAALTSANAWIGKFNSSLVLQATATVAGAGGNTDQVRGIALGSNGDIYVTGIINNSGVTTDAWFGRYTSALAPVSNFSLAGVAATNDQGNAIASYWPGYLIGAGSLSQSGQGENLVVAQLSENAYAIVSTTTVNSSGSSTDIAYAVVVDSNSNNALLAGFVNSGADGWAGLFTFNTPAPAAPSAFAGAASSSTFIDWSWTDNSSDETGFRVMSGTNNVSGDLAANSASWQQTGLAPNTAQTLFARVFNATGTADSSSVTRYTLAEPPNGLSITFWGSSVTLTWPSMGNPASTLWSVERGTTGVSYPLQLSLSSAASSFTGDTLAANASYYYRIRAVNNDGAYSFHANASGVVFTGGAPAAPTGLAGAAQGTSSIQWSWTDNSSDESGFRVMTGTISLSGDLAANTTVWVQAGMGVNASSGPVFVRAFNSTGTADSGSLSRYTLAAAPSGLATLGVHRTSAAFSWSGNGNPGGTIYTAQASTSAAFSPVISTSPLSASTTISALASGTTYYIRVRAQNGDGVATAFSSTVTIVTSAAVYPVGELPAVVTAVSPESGAQGSSPSLTATGTRFGGSTGLYLERISGTGSWAGTGALPRAVDAAPSVLLDDGRVMVAGGMNTANGSVILSSTVFYDPAAGTWSNGPDMSSRRHHFALIKLKDGRVLAAGGQVTSSPNSYTSSAEIYDPATGAWTPTGSFATARLLDGVLLQDGRVLVAGGFDDAFRAEVDLWDPATGSWTARSPLPAPRASYQLTLLNDGRVLASGGNNLSGVLGNADVYDPTADSWTAYSTMSVVRYAHRAILLPDGRVLTAGGSDAVGPTNTVQIFDPATGNWTAGPNMSANRYDPRLVLHGGRVLVAGGMNSTTGPTATASVQAWDPGASTWTAMGSLGTPRFDFVLERLRDGRLLAAGGEGNNSTALSSGELFTVTGTTIAATGVSAPSSFTLTGTVSLAGAATGYWDVVARSPGEGRLAAGFRVLSPALSSLSVSPSTITLTPGATQPLTVVGTYTDGSTGTVAGVLFASSAPAVASVSGAGLVTGVSTGATVVTASSGAASASASVSVAFLPSGDLSAVVTAVDPSSGPTGASRSLTLTGTRFTGATGFYLERISGTGSWAGTGALPRAVDAAPSVLLDDGRVMVAGGINTANASVVLSSTSFFDPATGAWSDGPNMNSRRHYFVLVKLLDGRVLAAGGQSSSNTYTNTAEIYDPATNLWTPTGSFTVARMTEGQTRLQDGRVLMAGGYDSTFRTEVDIWDPATGSWTARAPLGTARSSFPVQLLKDGRVAATGGSNGSGFLSGTEIYDPVANAWTSVSSMSTARHVHRAALLPDGRVFVAGGSTSGGVTNTVEILDPVTGAWTAGPNMSVGRYDPRLVWHGGRLIVAGGMSSATGPTATTSVQAYDLATNAWTALGSLATARFDFMFERLRDGRLLAAGGEGDNSTALAGCELFTVAGTTIAATGVSAPSSFTLTGTVSLAGAATGYWDVVARTPGEGRLPAGFRVTIPALVSLSVTPSSASLEVGGQQAFVAAGTYDNGSTATVTSLVTWTSSPTAVATVSTSGVVTAQAAGTAVVTASTGSLVATASVTVSAFPAPTGFGGTALGATSIRWDWTDNASGELGYRVMSGTTNLSGDLPPNTTSWTQTGLSPNTQYGPYFARVFNAASFADSNTASKKTKANPPGGSSSPSFSATVATVTWSLNGNPSATTAEIHRSTDNAAFSLLVSSAVTLLRDDSLLGCTSYYYKVRNADEDGFSAYDTTVLVRTLDTIPGSPGSLAAEAVAGGRVALAWTGSITEGVTGYKLYGDGGTGVFDYGTPLAVFTSTESSWTTGVLASSAAYAFNLRALHRCGTEDAAGVQATAASTATLSSVRAAIKNPDAGKRIAGNRVTVMAELTAGTPQTVSQVQFQYRASTAAPWTDIPAANVNHPNPDLGAPYFTHWDVTALTQGVYHLRAVAYAGNTGAPDPAPGSITVIVDAAAPDISENVVAGEIIKQQAVNNAVVNTIASGGGDAGDALAKIVLPPGALNTSTVTVTVEANPDITTGAPSGYSSVGSSLRVDLSNGQHNLSGGQTACITLSYPSNVTDPSALAIWSLDEGTGVWSRDFATTVNASSRTITGCTPHFSIFAVFQGVATSTLLDGVRLYPNPYKPNSGNIDEGKPFSLGDDSSGIIIDLLPARVTIEIYSVSGRLVTRFETNASGGKIRWNARNSDGRDVASGGYFAVISSPGMKPIVKKFIVIR